jgi:hypothetical protein
MEMGDAMYLRWKTKPRKGKKNHGLGSTTLVAVLVECRRENGKVKQNLVKYLGSIQKDKIDLISRRKVFWIRVLSNLDGIKMGNKKRKQLLTQIIKIVPNPGL